MFNHNTRKALQIALIPLFIGVLFLWLNGIFPALFNPILWVLQPKSSIFTLVVRYSVPAVLLAATGMRNFPIFFILQAPCICVVMYKFISNQINYIDNCFCLFLVVYGLLMPLLSIFSVYVSKKLFIRNHHV